MLLLEPLLEDTYRDLRARVDSGRRQRAKPLAAHFVRVQNNNQDFVFVTQSGTQPRNASLQWTQFVRFVGLSKLKGQKPTQVQFLRALQQGDLLVYCNCLHPDTWVTMADGTYRRITDVRVGEMVLTHKGRPRRVTSVMARQNDKPMVALDIVGRPESLLLTYDHQLLTVRGNEFCACGCGKPMIPRYKCQDRKAAWAKCFRRGHSGAVSLADVSSEPQQRWVEAEDLVHRECLFAPRPLFEEQESFDPDLARLYGYYVAEGCIESRVIGAEARTPTAQIDGELHSVYGVKLIFNENEIDTLVADVVRLAAKFGVETLVEHRGYKAQKWVEVRYKSPAFALDCLRLFGRGSKTKRLHPSVFGWSRTCQEQLCVGMINGDGHLYKSGVLVYDTSSFVLHAQFSTLLHGLDVWHTRAVVGRRGVSRHYHSGDGVTNRIKINVWEASRLRDLLKPYLRECDEGFFEYSGRPVNQQRACGGFIYGVRGKRVFAYDGPVYDLSVEEDQSFLANGVVVHNCPDFLYHGFKYMGIQQGYGINHEHRPPNIRNPKLEGSVCKHLYNVLQVLPANTSQILKQLRKQGYLEPPDRRK